MSEPPRTTRPGPSAGRLEPRWYRSLYWRIALGLIAFIAVMLAAEGALFLWTTERIAGSMPANSPRRLADIVASDVAAALAAEPTLDLEQYVLEHYRDVFQTFLVVMRDGRVVSNHDDVPQELMAVARSDQAELRDFQRRQGGRRRGVGPNSGAEIGGATARGRGRMGGDSDIIRPRERGEGLPAARRAQAIRGGESSLVMVGGVPLGRVSVLPGGPPFSRIVRVLGPTMALAGGGVLAVGTTLIALLVFGPVRRRLGQVQHATERLGAGDLTARAPDGGGDEVAAVARSFNRMADELTSRARALEASDRARRQLLADVSHELMTPLTAMRGYIETLSMPELSLDATTRARYLGIVTEETHRLEHIIGDLLDLARLEGGGTAMRREEVAIETIFGRVAARHERELSSRRIALVQRVEPLAERMTGDADRLEQALQNLAANALRHTPDDGQVLLEATPEGERVRITVRDSGPGIPEEHLPLIFDRFYKVDAARKAAGGSGLGLSIVKAIIERHGGTISARNDRGAVFDIRLPR